MSIRNLSLRSRNLFPRCFVALSLASACSNGPEIDQQTPAQTGGTSGTASSGGPGAPAGTGGSVATGGSLAAGGSGVAAGGANNSMAGAVATSGGMAAGGNSTGGALATAGGMAVGGAGGSTGGTPAAGGVSTGGATAAGGMSVGGATAAGGMAGGKAGGMGGGGGSGGSAPGSAPWGEVENPGADCTVTDQFPTYAQLTANGKLPDPFTKMDGTRITNKSEWKCRRAELVKQLANYIYGEKPIPPAGSVSGTVTSSKITVSVSGGKKAVSFSVTVDMNGATAPAPALISYGAGAPAPNGVAKITFSAIESSGGSGAKNGPFFDYYGSDHPAGYMVAQAWQVSRIIDLIQQDPSVIDPHHIGVTGCSRNGKGAFAGGALDNRVALTIPCESGIGGAVALRLKEQLDPGANSTNEWPYHAISYVRWLSEVALGPFATANDAAGDNTDRLPVDMHEMMALIAPRAIYIVDNAGLSILDPKSSYVTAMAGKAIFEALGVGDHFAYQGASGSHCQWRTQYQAPLDAMINRFLKGNDATATGTIDTDLGSKPDPKQYYTWDATELSGEL